MSTRLMCLGSDENPTDSPNKLTLNVQNSVTSSLTKVVGKTPHLVESLIFKIYI